ncbi:DNA cytosine methyltransferase [Bacillus subtilis]|nr:DNA cytosine methyltransferase [Bacillus subtilis]
MVRFRLGEYFSGPGGMAKGAHLAAGDLHPSVTLEHAWAVDIDADSCETYRRNITGATNESVIVDDVRGALERHELGPIDGFAFGFPCNDFSLVGEHKGIDGNYGGLYKSGIDVLKNRRPKWFIAENVGGIRSANDGRAFDRILREMQESGYRIYPHLYRFEQYGVPQARHRVIIVGIEDSRENEGIEFRVPSPELYAHVDVTAKAALEAKYPPNVKNHEMPALSERVVERLKLIDPGENAFNAARMTDEYRLNVKGATISQIYRRLLPDRPSYTVTGSGGGGTHVYHWDEPRSLTNRERARLQSFPDDYVFVGKRTSVRKQVGMAVPVNGARAIFKALFSSFLGEEYPSIPANIEVPTNSATVKISPEIDHDLQVVALPTKEVEPEFTGAAL